MKKKWILILSAACLLAFILCTPAYAKEKKTMMLGMNINEKKGATDFVYGFHVCYDSEEKVGNGTFSVSGTILLPKDLLAKKNQIFLEPSVGLRNPNILVGDDYIGSVASKDWLKISVNKKGKVSLLRFTKEWKQKKLGSMASIKKSGDYYVLKLNKMPLMSKYVPANGQGSRAIDKNRPYIMDANIRLFVWPKDADKANKLSKKVNSFCYLARFCINATKPLCLSVENLNFSWFYCYREKGGKANSTKRVPMRLAYMSY